MKKLICLLLVLIAALGAVGLVGCGEDNASLVADLRRQLTEAGVDNEGFVEVYSVTYGDNVTLKSEVTIEYDGNVEITAEEYEELPKYSEMIITKDKRKVNASQGDYVGFEYEEYQDYKWCKTIISTIEYNIVNVKIISDREYLIKNNDGTKRITSDFFEIVYFN